MKRIVYVKDGTLYVVGPSEGWRLCAAVTIGRVTIPVDPPRPVSTVLRQWPVAGATAKWAESEDDLLARVLAKDVPRELQDSAVIVDAADLPADRTYRNAWGLDGGRVVHDMQKARGLHRERMRAERAPRLAALDVEYQRADEDGDAAAKKAIAARKQELRDVTKSPGIEHANSVDELKAVWPACLGDTPA